jgi:hypothetical protein
MADFDRTATQVGDLFTSEVAKVPERLDEFGNVTRDVNSHLQSLAGAMERSAYDDPYMDAFRSPVATRQGRLAESQDLINANYDRYGANGRQIDSIQRGLADDMAARGISSGGNAQRLQQELALSTQQQKAADLAKAQMDADDYQMKAANVFQSGKQLRGNQLAAAGDLTNVQAANANQFYNQALSTANQLGNQYGSFGNMAANMEKQGRDEEQNVKSFNLQGAYQNQAMNADRKNQFGLADWNAKTQVAMATPSMGQRLMQAGSLLGGLTAGLGGGASGGGGAGGRSSSILPTYTSPTYGNSYTDAHSYSSPHSF